MARPQRAMSPARSRAMRSTTAAPTVPRPARPTLSGATMRFGNLTTEAPKSSAALGEGDDVVQLFRRGFKEPAQVAGRLPDALLVLDQRTANEPLAVLAEADAGRHRELGLLDQQGRELDGAKRAERLGQRRPGEHRGA